VTWTVNSGTQTAVISTEHTLATRTSNATFSLLVDINALADVSEKVELRLYSTILNGGTERLVWKGTFDGSSICKIAQSEFLPSDQSMHVTLKQLTGTGRAFPWKLMEQ
jgi:hypothetical protein